VRLGGGVLGGHAQKERVHRVAVHDTGNKSNHRPPSSVGLPTSKGTGSRVMGSTVFVGRGILRHNRCMRRAASDTLDTLLRQLVRSRCTSRLVCRVIIFFFYLWSVHEREDKKGG
jgi:hypothetical protein